MARGRREGESLTCLLAQALSGDQAARHALLEALYPILYRDLASKKPDLVQEALLKDAVHEGMLRIDGNLEQVRSTSEGGIIQWALVVGRNAATEFLRATHEGPLTVSLIEEHDGTPDEQDHGIDECLHVLVTIVDEVLDTLRDEENQLLLHKLQRGDPWAVAGEEMGITPDAAKVRYQRLRGRLQQKTMARVDALEEPGRTAVRKRLGLS